jgi:hypothetical protein
MTILKEEFIQELKKEIEKSNSFDDMLDKIYFYVLKNYTSKKKAEIKVEIIEGD